MELSEEIVDYVFRYYGELMTRAEQAASMSMAFEQKAEVMNSEAMKRRMLELRDSRASQYPEVPYLASLGPATFKRVVVERILRQDGDRVFLNYCPTCGALARTPRARQCPKCFHDWHELPAE